MAADPTTSAAMKTPMMAPAYEDEAVDTQTTVGACEAESGRSSRFPGIPGGAGHTCTDWSGPSANVLPLTFDGDVHLQLADTQRVFTAAEVDALVVLADVADGQPEDGTFL